MVKLNLCFLAALLIVPPAALRAGEKAGLCAGNKPR